jgi:hypothetical protein
MPVQKLFSKFSDCVHNCPLKSHDGCHKNSQKFRYLRYMATILVERVYKSCENKIHLKNHYVTLIYNTVSKKINNQDWQETSNTILCIRF